MNKPREFRKKPVVVEAIEYDGGNINELIEFTNGAIKPNLDSASGIHRPTIPTLEGEMKVSIGDFVIRGVQSEYYPCRGDIFKATYDAV